MTRLILLDRDGVINYDSPDYIKDADEWVAIPGALQAIARLKEAGYLVAVCSNQAGIGRGVLTPAALERIHAKMRAALAREGAVLDGLRFCPHHPDEGCGCRKPRPGMLTDSMVAFGVEPADTFYVGDRLEDVQAAKAAGCRAVLVRSGSGIDEGEAHRLGVEAVADDLADFVASLLEHEPC